MSTPTTQEEIASVLRDARSIGLGVKINRKPDEAIRIFEPEPPADPPLEKIKHGAL